MTGKKVRAFLIGLVALAAVAALFQVSAATANPSNSLRYEVKAKNATLIRRVLGEVTTYVNGVPASPVDAFSWDGQGVTPIQGSVKLKIDPVSNTGEIKAEWKDENGEWEYRQTVFSPPDHSTGLQVGPGANDTKLITGDPVTTNVYLHGDTTAGGPVLPTVFNLLTTWGPAEITLNGQPFENTLDGTPTWPGHTMTTVGVRDENGQVLATDGTIFNPSKAAMGVVYDDELEFHLVFHDMPDGPDAGLGNIPPPPAFFYHVTFNDVKVKIEGAD